MRLVRSHHQSIHFQKLIQRKTAATDADVESMRHTWEGVVLVAEGMLKKWKTALEDESKGGELLRKVLSP